MQESRSTSTYREPFVGHRSRSVSSGMKALLLHRSVITPESKRLSCYPAKSTTEWDRYRVCNSFKTVLLIRSRTLATCSQRREHSPKRNCQWADFNLILHSLSSCLYANLQSCRKSLHLKSDVAESAAPWYNICPLAFQAQKITKKLWQEIKKTLLIRIKRTMRTNYPLCPSIWEMTCITVIWNQQKVMYKMQFMCSL